MGWLNTPAFSIQEAQQRGLDIYEVLYKDWGLSSDGTIGDQWPPFGNPGIGVSLAGIAIGPRSLVDQAWLTYNFGKTFTAIANLVPTQLTSRIRQFGVGSPLIFTQTAGQGQNTRGQYDELVTMNLHGSMYVWPQNSFPAMIDPSVVLGATGFEAYGAQVPFTYVPGNVYTDVNGVSRFLSSIGVTQDYPNGGFVGPLLHLHLYLKTPVVVPAVRAPLKVALQVDTSTAARFPATERLVAQIATFGRRTVHLMMFADRPCTFRVGAIRVWGGGPQAVNTEGVIVPANCFEEPVEAITTVVAANTPVVLSNCASGNYYADFTNLYATAQDGSKPIVTFVMSGWD